MSGGKRVGEGEDLGEGGVRGSVGGVGGVGVRGKWVYGGKVEYEDMLRN